MAVLLELLKPLERLLNKGFESSKKAREISAQHAGKVLAVLVSKPNFSVHIEIQDSALRFLDGVDIEPDTTLGGDLVDLIKLAKPNPERTLRETGIVIEGDAGFAQAIQELMAALKPDPEEELSKVFGDVTAHQVGRAVEQFSNWTRTTLDTFGTNFREFLSEESRDLPTRYETEEFMGLVETLRDDIDRMIARLEKVQSKL